METHSNTHAALHVIILIVVFLRMLYNHNFYIIQVIVVTAKSQ